MALSTQLSAKTRWIVRFTVLYGLLYVIATTAVHLIRLHAQHKPLNTDLWPYLAGDVVAALIMAPVLGWYAWRQRERRAKRPRS